MNIPATPTEMQAFIVEQLLQDGSATNEQAESKTRIKFSKQFGDELEVCLREKLFHGIRLTGSEPEEVGIQKYSETATKKSPVSLLKQYDGRVIAVLRCDQVVLALLSRLFFGGDIESHLRPADRPPTNIEVGLQGLLARYLSKTLSETAQLECGTAATFSVEDFDSDEVPNENAFTCQYEIQAGRLKCKLEIAMFDTVIAGTSDDIDVAPESAVSAPNFELMQSKIAAKVKLKPVSASLKSIQNLKVGDHLSLGAGGNLEGVFEVNGQTVHDCDIGRSGEIYCLKISDRSSPTDTVPHSQPSVG